jgi:hypothetical protein
VPQVNNVWLVEYDDAHGDHRPVAAFTVKHELVTWLQRQPPHRLTDYYVYRMGDGPGQGEPVEVSQASLLPA